MQDMLALLGNATSHPYRLIYTFPGGMMYHQNQIFYDCNQMFLGEPDFQNHYITERGEELSEVVIVGLGKMCYNLNTESQRAKGGLPS